MDSTELDRLYAGHVRALEEAFARVLPEQGWDAAVIHSGSLLKRSQFDDQSWSFRPCPHFQHWLPLAEPECVVVVRPGHRATLLRTNEASFWEQPRPPESDAFAAVLEVEVVRDPAMARARLPAGRVAFVGEQATRSAEWGIDADASCPPALVAALDELRTTKTDYEAACIAEANRRARAGHEALRDAFRSGDASELELHLLFLRATAQDDPETPYKNIVALGQHASTLHHIAYGRDAPTRGSESLLVDAGATCRGYGSDVTRTWVRGTGATASTFSQLVAGLDSMQQGLCTQLRAGVPYEALHDESHKRMAALLKEVGIVRGSTEEAVESGVTRAFYPHGLGHSLGLQTHDVGCALRPPREDNPFLRNTSDVAVGQVVTIEPGVYFIEALLAELRAQSRHRASIDWSLVDALTPLGGARTEDDLLVVEDGARNLTREHLASGGGLVA